ncbi:MAG: thiamine phosphate synthase [Actinobacteria bacterium]|nr:thiamine phosphate synthase [Actinomycetota bacterium]
MSRRPDWVQLAKFIVIMSGGGAPGRTHEDVAIAALKAGCRAVQLRDKDMADRDFAEIARRIKDACGNVGALLFINDRVDVAAVVGCDGVHLGVYDLEVADARRVLGPDAIIGYSPEGIEDARRAVKESADYLGIGPVFRTPSKEDAGEPIGPEGLASHCREFTVPVIAVGGIDAGNAASALAAGAVGIAVVSAVSAASDMDEAARELLKSIEDVPVEPATE